MLKQASDKFFSEMPELQGTGKSLLLRAKGDKVIWGIVLLLSLISILVVYSATGSLAYKKFHGNNEMFLFKQIVYSVIGLIVIYFLHQVNYTLYSKIATVLFLMSIPLLLYTLFFGARINDGSRWIKVPIINLTVQTSDFARLALFMYLSKVLSKRQDTIKSFKKGFLPCILPVAIICIFIMPANLSNALLTGATSLILMFIGRVNVKYLLAVIGLAFLPIIGLVTLANTKHKLETESNYKNSFFEAIASKGRIGTWVSRVEDFMYPSLVKKEITQRDQANMAIANGSIFFGLGPGNSIARNFLPQAYNDFIFAVIIEEYGLLGALFIMFIYLLFLFRCIRIFRNCPYAFGAFLTIGLSFTLIIQALANMAVSVGVVPVTGVTLPLISMGGSSFLFTCASIGIILSVGRHIEKEQALAKVKPIIPVTETN